jgi:hypothetical protein
MSLNLSEPVTTNGTLKLTGAEYDYLNSTVGCGEVRTASFEKFMG